MKEDDVQREIGRMIDNSNPNYPPDDGALSDKQIKQIRNKAKEADEIELLDFVRLAILEERAACLKAVEQAKVNQIVWYPEGYSINANKIGDIYKFQHERCIEAIRARGDK